MDTISKKMALTIKFVPLHKSRGSHQGVGAILGIKEAVKPGNIQGI